MLSDIGPKLDSTQSQILVSRGLNLCVSETLDVGEVCVQQEMSSSGGEEGSYRPYEADLMQMGQEFRDLFFFLMLKIRFALGIRVLEKPTGSFEW